MIYILAFSGALLITLFYKRAILLIPVWTLFTPKALLLLDVPGAPVLSLYKFFCAVLVVNYFFRVILVRRVRPEPKPLTKPFLVLFFSGAISVVANIGSANAGVLTWIAMALEIFLPVTIYCHYLAGLSHERLRSLSSLYIKFYCALAVYGSICYLIDYNPYIDFISSTVKTGRVVAQTYAETLRGIRAQGTISHPITYGALIVSMLIVYVVIRIGGGRIRFVDAIWLFFAGVVVIVGALLTNSRTPLVLLIVPIVFYVLAQSPVRAMKQFIVVSLLFFVAFFSSDVVKDKALSVVNIFDPSVGVEQHGSSLEMREVQLYAAQRYMFMSPVLGGGLDRARNIVASGLDPDLFDTESLAFKLMIDQGALGIVSYAVFFILLYLKVSAVVRVKKARRLYLGFIIGYLVFVLATGVMDTLQNILFLVCLVYYTYRGCEVRH